MYSRNHHERAYIVIGLVAILFLLCAVRLVKLQIVHGKEYRKISEDKLYVSMSVKAPRGEILDRYGTILVGNRTGFSIQISDNNMEEKEFASMLKELIVLLEKQGVNLSDALPVTKTTPLEFTFKDSKDKTKLQKEAEWKEEYNISVSATPDEVVKHFSAKYEVNSNLDILMQRKVAGVIFDMKSRGFSVYSPYVIATDVSPEVVATVKENNMSFPVVEVVEQTMRYYPDPKLAAHTLGTVGIIYKEEFEKLKAKNYSTDAIIGKQGIEYTFEDYLRGQDGINGISVGDADNNIVESVPAKAGNQVLLTIDKDVQKTLEKFLESTILNSYTPDCDAGAGVCIDVNSGEILAIASYPSYDLTSYNKDYDKLLANSANPLWNRAISGTYEPGSTFKMLTAIAALEEGIISPEETILDKGVYEYYDDYQPSCLEWKYGKTHGYVNTELALQESCNYYFYDIGRRLGIDKLVMYAEKFGLGKPTGIEISGESDGIVASPENREKRGGTWYPGDTLQASIGQSDNLFTPIQLASYVATIANGGTRYKPHLLKTVKNTQTGQIVKESSSEILEKIEISQSTLSAVKNGMKKVTEEGTAEAAFKDFSIKVGGKTGTAEVPNGSSNGIFVAFAPFDNPEIAVAIVLEHGGHGSEAAPIARAIFETYFNNKTIVDKHLSGILLK